MENENKSIFHEYYHLPPFVDRYVEDPTQAVDVIIPVIHTNELWKANLLSFYREVPIHKLIIGDGGCIDNSIEVAREFPRVQVLDHRSYKSLGFSIRGLIEAVETDWFIYIHSDAYLPVGWFAAMEKHQAEYDWFGCPMQHTVMVEYNLDYGNRPWAGSQMGRKKAFGSRLEGIDDDYVYRQEDFVFAEMVEKGGFKVGKVTDTFHYHQTIRKASPWSRKIKSVSFDLEMSPEEEVRASMMQVKGLVKYVTPDPQHVRSIVAHVDRLQELGKMDWAEFTRWVKQTNPAWLPLIAKEARLQAWRRLFRAVKQVTKRMLV
jgi:hypothetical protein